MFHNYFFIKRLARSLDQVLSGGFLVECFSQNKDELILTFFVGQGEFIIRANLDPIVSLLQFPDSFGRARKNSIDLFTSLVNKKVRRIRSYQFERSFYIEFNEGDILIFKMHARRANILHVVNNSVVDIFRKKLSRDNEIIPGELDNQIEVSESNFQDHMYDPLSFIPAFGKEVKIALEKENYFDLPNDQKWDILNTLLEKLEKNPIYLHDSNPPRISLVEDSIDAAIDPIQATNWLYEKAVRTLFFQKEKDQIINQLLQKIKKSENYILKSTDKLYQITSARNPEEIANLIMANLHFIQKGLSKVVLIDFYKNEPITIKLNEKISPQKNAEIYYRKGKNRHQEIDTIKKNITSKEKLIHQISKQILDVQEIQTNKELKKFKKSKGLEKTKKNQLEVLPYHLFELEGWQILVGKNSKANDELTLKVANKNDLWLHAKDVPGSHVVIKEKPGQGYPTHIIEYAAGLAAANSKRKTDSIAPVIFTNKKYVRKVKGAPAGQVIVEKEETLMIEPFSDSS